jgi:hypothetical protein
VLNQIDNDDAVNFKDSKEIDTKNRIIKITEENLRAADSNISREIFYSDIAILTRDHILKKIALSMKK